MPCPLRLAGYWDGTNEELSRKEESGLGDGQGSDFALQGLLMLTLPKYCP